LIVQLKLDVVGVIQRNLVVLEIQMEGQIVLFHNGFMRLVRKEKERERERERERKRKRERERERERDRRKNRKRRKNC